MDIITPRLPESLSDEQCTKMYGTDKEGLESLFVQMGSSPTASDLQMMSMGLLSDVQQMMACGANNERVRQMLNVSKWLMSHVQTYLRNKERGI